MEDNASESAAPSGEERRTVYEKGFRIWQSLYLTYNNLPVSGSSIWIASLERSQEPCNIPPLERHLQIPVSIKSPTPIKENHLSVLVFAWSYILSARWTELMPEAALVYTESKAYNSDKPEEDDSAVVDIGVADDDAARWWAAILARAEGWEAYIAINKDKFRSPWSISLSADPNLPYHKNHYLPSETAVSAATAFRFLNNYCALHDIVDQAYAALSIVLLLPLLHNSGEDIVLPRPKFRHEHKNKVESSRYNVQLDLAWVQVVHYLDKLLTLSCNTKGIRSLLSSVFYEPGIACNVVSPWLQAIFAVVSSVEDNRILAEETMQSFMQDPIQPAADSHIQRSDECRLLYLTQEEYHTCWPVCQWRPFGATALKDTDIDVRILANCTGHGLQYAGFKWTCRNGRVVHQMLEPALAPTFLPAAPVVLDIDIVISYEALNHGEETASENATRSIFNWLRVDGYPPGEKRIHEWAVVGQRFRKKP
ncbi:hypothetical protein BDW72DRAFT_206821 [Aspergillus terricola var. indicus]